MTEYKPTYEQLEKAVAVYDHAIESILEHAKYGTASPSNAEIMAQSHRLMVNDANEAICEARYAMAPPVPTYEEIEEIVGWVNVYQSSDGSIKRGLYTFGTEEEATREANDCKLSTRISCQPIRVTVKREKKRPVEHTDNFQISADGRIWNMDGTVADYLHDKVVAVTWTEDPTT